MRQYRRRAELRVQHPPPPDGLSHHEAASQISRLLVRARALGKSGVSLKNDEDPALGAPPAAAAPPLAGRPR